MTTTGKVMAKFKDRFLLSLPETVTDISPRECCFVNEDQKRNCEFMEMRNFWKVLHVPGKYHPTLTELNAGNEPSVQYTEHMEGDC